jgi:hypothetical protein
MTSIFDDCPHRVHTRDDCPFRTKRDTSINNDVLPLTDEISRYNTNIDCLIKSLNTGMCPFNVHENISKYDNTKMPCLFYPDDAIDCPVFRERMNAKPNESFIDCIIRQINIFQLLKSTLKNKLSKITRMKWCD